MMKSHAYIRTNVPRVLNSKNKLKVDDVQEQEVDENFNNVSGTSRVQDKRITPTFGMYLYFLFAPTIIYRDQYPRTNHIRWGFVVRKLLEVLAVIFLLSFVFERVMNPRYGKYGKMQEVDVGQLVLSIFHCMMPGLLCFVCGFYCVLHSWLNATAEMLKFSDRMFYKDWWNCTSFAVYYRNWNVVVHDWLYTYIYKDFYEHILNKNRYVCQLVVFTISALVHEYILAFTFKFCYPVMFILFEGFGVLLVFVTRRESRAIGNIFMWFSVAFGMGIMLSLYHIEYYARINCVNENKEWWDLFVPLSWRCTMLTYSSDWKIQIHL
jgi:sterol O-acyltransferase